jgi:hypothetical protein
MDENYSVLAEFDSWGMTEDAFVHKLVSWWGQPLISPPEVMVVEDLPHGLSYSTLVKTVCRLQGRIAQAMETSIEDILYVAPATWRAHYEMKRGTGPNEVFPVVERFGYKPPDLTVRAKGNGGQSKAKKVQSDYCSAYLIARWAIDTKKHAFTYDVPGTSRYATTVIRKKDFNAQDR